MEDVAVSETKPEGKDVKDSVTTEKENPEEQLPEKVDEENPVRNSRKSSVRTIKNQQSKALDKK